MKLEVLVATMNQKNFNKYKEMNLDSDVIFANQDDRFEYIEKLIDDNTVKMITTSDRGVGKNRNMALMKATADICLFADDDMIYENGYKEIVTEAFDKVGNADIIIFNIETIGNETRGRRINKSVKKCNKYNVLNYGAARIAVKRESLMKKNIWFSSLYGGGAPYSSGEDSLFLIEAINKGAKIYTYPKMIAGVKQETSTWFNGYNEKFFFDKGIWIKNAFPKIGKIIVFYYAYRFRNITKEYNGKEILKLMLKGLNQF